MMEFGTDVVFKTLKTNFIVKEALLVVLFSVLFISFASGASPTLNVGVTPLSSWINNQTIHYRYYNSLEYLPITSIQISPVESNFTETYNNYYYLNQYANNNTNAGTMYRLGSIAYPQSFITSMIENNFSACSPNSTNDSGSNSFFSALCEIYKTNINASFAPNESSTEINSTIQSLVAELMPDDIFTKQLYGLYYNYSSVCNGQGMGTSAINGSLTNNDGIYNISYNPNKGSAVTMSICQGTKTDPAFPYFGDYVKYIASLTDFMDIQKN